MKQQLYIGNNPLRTSQKKVEGKWMTLEQEDYYCIENYDQMPPFLMSIVSNSDHWMYLSSNGSLTAGRANPESALFPYYTDDKIHDYAEVTGSKTILKVTTEDKTSLWEPFSVRNKGAYQGSANLYKNAVGNKIIFEEVNHDLKITFRYAWMNSDRFGWVRKGTLINHSDQTVEIELVDGLTNLLPYGVNRNMQGMLSTLVDAYKKSELVEGTTLGLYRLSSIPVDRAEPSEALKVTTVWSTGLNPSAFLMGTNQLEAYRKGDKLETENESLGVKGAYLVNATVQLKSKEEKNWYVVAEVNQDAVDVAGLLNLLKANQALGSQLEMDIQKGTEQLVALVAQTDGLQLSADQQNVKRHFANAMFNAMRGGIPYQDYTVLKTDFIRHIRHFNVPLFNDQKEWLNKLPEKISYPELTAEATVTGDDDLLRLSLEYLPFMFSRRHGDPSRPWNLFSIKLKNEDGTPSLYYQGNWRDIFQNWEALAMSYPAFLPGMIAKFLNASTIDGFNAYKITRDGIEWEILDPEDPWSNIGYWGDHQIIYLEKLLELSEKFHPGQLKQWMHQSIFAYANVPYRLKPYTNLVENPQDSIEFDDAKNTAIEKLVAQMGADGKLLQNDQEVYRVSLAEKLMVPLLSKLSSFIPGAGIWMNTQRPEWNDANNALVGNGASMVTLYYIKRYASFLKRLFKDSDHTPVKFTVELAAFLGDLITIFEDLAEQPVRNNLDRRIAADRLGEAGSKFRNLVYNEISATQQDITRTELEYFLDRIEVSIDRTIAQNQRSDGLFHAYNLIRFTSQELQIRTLSEMLEGQVAVLSSGYLEPEQALHLLDQLGGSALYRPDQNSYMLYPNKKLPLFLEKNNLDEQAVKQSELLSTLVNDGETSIIQKDENGSYHFNGKLNNSGALKDALKHLAEKYSSLVVAEQTQLLTLYDDLFDHQSFTGRSGSFYKYEGLGSIYWHMVSKLLLAVGEQISSAIITGCKKEIIQKLKVHYQEIRAGIGAHKSPDKYGAFPTDPYSHTPSMAGVQQPGMTGQVKEDLLSRWFELGVEVNSGCLSFHPERVEQNEFIDGKLKEDDYFVEHFGSRELKDQKLIAFSLCHIPIYYLLTNDTKVVLSLLNGEVVEFDELHLNEKWSRSIFNRGAEVQRITVYYRNT